MTDYIHEISFDPEIEDVVHGHLFLTRSTGNTSPCEGVIAAYFDSNADRDAAAAALQELAVTVSCKETPRVGVADSKRDDATSPDHSAGAGVWDRVARVGDRNGDRG